MNTRVLLVLPSAAEYQVGRHLEFSGHGLVLFQAGLGVGSGQRVGRRCKQDRPQLVLLCGYAGALQAQLRATQIVVCQEVGAVNEQVVLRSSLSLVEHASTCLQAIALPGICGSSLTVPEVIATPQQKQSYAGSTGALVVEMENYWVAQAVQAQGLPFLAVRAVLDTAEEVLPDLSGLLDEQGYLRLNMVICHLLTHPWHLPLMLHLGKRGQQACRSLAHFLDKLLPLL